ncbi:MAG: ABC transporter substrate-binding protein [Chloroflexota bacterium]|nr:ABC transporter substrate-binding protein [Chloroflexota bacterium]
MDDGYTRFSRLSRRGFLGGIAASAAAAILAACGGSATATPQPASTTGAATTAGTAPTTAAGAATSPASTAAAAATKPAASAVTGAASTSAPAVSTTASSSSVAVSGTTAPSGSAVASSGVAGTIPPPSADKFKGMTLNMISRNEYFKSSEQALDSDLADWAKLIGIKVNNDRVNVDTGDFATKVDAAVKAGSPPDLVYVDRFLSQFVQLGDLTDMADSVTQAQQVFGPVEDGSKINLMIDGKWWCLPYFANGNGWFARKDWLAEKNIQPTSIKTFEQLRDAALAISDPSKNRFGWGLTTNTGGDGTGTVTSVVYAYGGAVVSNDGKKVVFNSPETVTAVSFLADIYTNSKYKNMLPPGVNGWTDTSNNEAWLAGTIGITQNAYTLYAQSFATKNPVYGNTAVLPGFTGPATEQVIATPGSGYLAIPKGAKNPDLAKATALYLIGGSAFLNLAKPSLGLIMPTYKNEWNTDPFYNTGDPSFPALRQIIEGKLPITTKTGYAFPQSPSPIYEQGVNGQHILNDMMGSIIQKGTKPADAVKAAHDQLVAAAVQLGLPQ